MQLAQRTAELGRCGMALCQNGWDVNAALLLAEDAERLANTSRRLDDRATAGQLETLAEHLWAVLDPPLMPDATATEAILELLETVATRVDESGPPLPPVASALFGYAASEENGFPLLVRPPADYWQRFIRSPRRLSTERVGDPAEIATAVVTGQTSAAPEPDAAPATDTFEPALPTVPPPLPHEVQETANTGGSRDADTPMRACHLGDGSPLAHEIDLKIQALGYTLQPPMSVDTLKEQLGRTPPSLIVLGSAHHVVIEEVGALVLAARARSGHAIRLVALSEEGDIGTRLRAMRAGCDALLVVPASADEIIARIRELGANDVADPYRIMIVEDDRAQVLFAETILRKNGMQTLAVCEAAQVLDQIDAFRPDLILMDLHMPGCDGLELTALIREREAYVSTPIVFLSGENDSERHFDAIDAGGDDFLSKPIAPRHLISAVSSRVRRARQLERRRRSTAPGETMIDGERQPMLETTTQDAARDAASLSDPVSTNGERILTAIHTALASSAYRMVYQPIVSLHGEEDEQFQALLRLPTEDGHTYSAGELVPVAEQAGLIVAIDQWALEHCIGAIADHLRNGRNLRLFVSQSLASVRDPFRVAWLREKLESQRVPAGQLSLELRIADAQEALTDVVAFTLALKQIGVSVTLSGFEAGADAGDLLDHLPVGFIKLSTRYTNGEDEALRGELRELVKTAHARGRQVIAPRVEEARMAAALWSSGVDLIQGNFVQQAARDMSYDFHTTSS